MAAGALFLQSLALASTSRWYGRQIYFVVTDRFAKTSSDLGDACSGAGWCGGTFKGLQRKLPYISSLGFDAIWITPVVKQVAWQDNYGNTGYHGYWAADFRAIEPHLGTSDDLHALIADCHARGMLVMVDVVANHVGPIHTPMHLAGLGAGINSDESFHQLGRKPGESFADYLKHPTQNHAEGCWPHFHFGQPGCNRTLLLDGWYIDLGDLNHEHEPTAQYLLSWIHDFVQEFSVDGLRLDTAIYMPMAFIKRFQEAAGVFIVAEVTVVNVTFHRSFQDVGALTGLLNFPLAFRVPHAFGTSGAGESEVSKLTTSFSLIDFANLLTSQTNAAYRDLHALGNFIDNHDGDRFLHDHGGDLTQLRNALTWCFMWHGIPILYYGTEQPAVSNQKDARTSMWPAHYGETNLTAFVRSLNSLRKQHGIGAGGHGAATRASVIAASTHALAFTRGPLLVLVTNLAAKQGRAQAALCVETTSLPLAWWEGVCSYPHEVVSALGAGLAFCDASGQLSKLCVTSAKGEPAAFVMKRLDTQVEYFL